MTGKPLEAIRWQEGRLYLLDQRRLPAEIVYVNCSTAAAVAEAIKEMVVRGAPAIGVSAAYGMVLAAREAVHEGAGFREALRQAAALLESARPTAVNLSWSLQRARRIIEQHQDSTPEEICVLLENEAKRLHAEDLEINRCIGDYGASLVPARAGVLTHCNAGALATAGYGTALGVIRSAFSQGKEIQVYAGETRPYLQGARLTALELQQDGIPVTLVTDGCAGYLMASGKVDLVVVGADRIASNGDTANKIGTYGLAVLAHYHRIPFYIAAPLSTIDRQTKSGAEIVIEERSPEEITHWHGKRLAPERVKVYNPAFDVTPAELISAIITERGIVHLPDRFGIEALFKE